MFQVMRLGLYLIFAIALAIAVSAAFSMPSYSHDASKTKEPPHSNAGSQYGQYGYNSQTTEQVQQQAQGQAQGQGQAQKATGGNAVSGPSTSTSGSVALSGAASNATTGASTSNATSGPSTATSSGGAGGTSAVNESSTNSGNVTYREAVNPVQPATMIISGCQVQGQAGGTNTRAAGMLGIGFTPAQCYDYIQAQAYNAIGAIQAACEILNHTKAALRAVRNGAVLPLCLPPAAPIAIVQAPGTYTRDQVDAIVRKVTSK